MLRSSVSASAAHALPVPPVSTKNPIPAAPASGAHARVAAGPPSGAARTIVGDAVVTIPPTGRATAMPMPAQQPAPLPPSAQAQSQASGPVPGAVPGVAPSGRSGPVAAKPPRATPAPAPVQGQGQAGGRGGPDAPVSFSASPSLIDTAMPMAPERYGKYHLLERIGVGGMAEVWRAKTLGSEGFTKDLVIKRILPKFTNDEESVRMFIDEARLVAKLHHPNIVQIFDFDKEGDRYYLAMELVEGRDLRQAEKAAAKAGVWFPMPIAIYLIAEALKGLHYAHTRLDHGQPLEIAHRDISPHNILISFSGDVKISDFGIAKVAARASNVGSASPSGTVKGKLAYMSPEQITGQPLDGRTDIYSMGVVFWELLTRHRLFFGPDEHDVIRRVRDGIVPSPRQYNPEIPEEVEQIVMKMLVAGRGQRYQTAGEVARALTALPQYAYEAQGLGEFMSTLFPEKTRNWTQMLQSMLSAPSAGSGKTTPVPASGISNPKGAVRISVPPAAASLEGATRISAPPGAGIAVSVPASPRAPRPTPPATRPVSASPPPLPVAPPAPVPPAAAPVSLSAEEKAPAPVPSPPSSAPPPVSASSEAGTGRERPVPPPAPPPVAPRSPMAGSEQKTQIATELPPEVAAAAARSQAQPSPVLASGARTVIAEAPALPPGPGAAMPPTMVSGGPPPMAPPPMAPPPSSTSAGARTLFAPAPQLPSAPPGGSLSQQQATVYSVPAPNAPVPPSATLPPVGRGVNPLPMVPAAVVIGGAAQSSGLPPQARWIIGPILALVVALVTTAVANRIWPPATNSGKVGPSLLAASRKIQILSEPTGAEVTVDGVVQDGKTPLTIKGDIGSSAQLRITLDGYEPREIRIAFPKDERPPLRVRLDKVGSKGGKVADADRFDDRPGTKTQPEPDEDEEKTAKPDDKNAAKPDDKSAAKPDDKSAAKPDDKTAAKPDDKSAAKPDDKVAAKPEDKKKDKKAKGLLTVTVRPWAIVFIDGKKIQQTPMRDYKISAGNHTVLLVNDTKGKRETIKLKVSAGESIPPITRTWQ